MDLQDQRASELLKLTEAIQNYYSNPEGLSSEQVDYLRQRAREFDIEIQSPLQIPDKKISPEEEQIGFHRKIGRFIGQLPIGYLEGLTTFRTGTIEPQGTGEAILRSIGHLGGFVAPWGVPHLATEVIGKGVKGIVSPAMAKAGTAWLRKSKHRMLGANIVKSALRLGTMSAVSNWQEGVDGMMKAMLGGMEAGAGFHILSYIGGTPAKALARVLATSLFVGLPSTLRGDTAPEQIYQYLLGAYFGRHHRNKALDENFLNQKEVVDFRKQAEKLSKTLNEEDLWNVVRQAEKVLKLEQEQVKKAEVKMRGEEVVPKEKPEEFVQKEFEPPVPKEEKPIKRIGDLMGEMEVPSSSSQNHLARLARDLNMPMEQARMEVWKYYDPDFAGFAHKFINGINARGFNYNLHQIRDIHNQILNTVNTRPETFVLTGKGLRTYPQRNPNDLRPVNNWQKNHNLPKRFQRIKDFMTEEGFDSLVNNIGGRFGKIGFEELVEGLNKNGYMVLGSPSDHDNLIIFKDQYRQWKKPESLAKHIREEWDVIFAGANIREMKDAANTLKAIEDIWNKKIARQFAQDMNDPEIGAENAMVTLLKRLNIPATRGIATPEDAVIKWNRVVLKRADNQIPALLVNDRLAKVLGIDISEISDGAEIEHSYLFRLKQYGLAEDPRSDFRKQSTHHSDPETAFSIKSGTFKGDPQPDRLMEQLGVGRIVFDTAMKVRTENIQPIDLRYDALNDRYLPVIDGKVDFEGAKTRVFNINPSSERTLFSAHAEQAGKHGMVSMLMQMNNFIQGDPAAVNAFRERVLKPNAQRVNQIISELVQNPKALEDAIRRAVDKDKETFLKENEANIGETPKEDLAPWLEKYRSGWDTGQHLLSEQMRHNTLRILTNWLVREHLLKPRWSGGLFVLRPVMPHNRTFNGGQLSEDGILLPASAREIVLKDGEYAGRKLGDVIDDLRARGQTRIDLNVLGARAPVSAVNAVKNLYIEGFLPSEGYTAVVHPKVVKEIKGDHDADEMHVYFGMPKEITTFFRNARGKQALMSDYMYTPQGTGIEPQLRKHLAQVTSIYDQLQRLRKSKDFVGDKRAVGEFANFLSKYVRALEVLGTKTHRMQWVEARKKIQQPEGGYILSKRRRYFPKDQVPDNYRMTGKKGSFTYQLNPNERVVREYLDSWLNTAVDSVKLGGLVPGDVYRDRIINKMFVVTGAGKTEKGIISQSLRNLGVFQDFTEFRNVIRKDYEEGRVYDINEITDRMGGLKKKAVLNIEHALGMADFKTITTENWINKEAQKKIENLYHNFGLGSIYPWKERRVRKIRPGARRASEYDRHLSRDLNKMSILNTIATPKEDGTHDALSIRNIITGDTLSKSKMEVFNKYLPNISKETVETLRKVHDLHQKMFGRESKPLTPEERLETAQQIEKIVKKRYDSLDELGKEEFMWMLDYADGTSQVLGLERVVGRPDILQRKANAYKRIVDQFLPEEAKEYESEPADLTVKDQIEQQRGAEKMALMRPEPKESIWGKDVKTYKEYEIKDSELRRLYDNLKRYPDFVSNFDEFVRWFFEGKPIKDLTYGDIKGLNAWFQKVTDGGFIDMFYKGDKKAVGLLDWLLFPGRVGDRMLRIDRTWVQRNTQPGQGKEPVSAMHKLIDVYRVANEKLNKEVEHWEHKIRQKFEYMRGITPRKSLDLQKIAVAKLESNIDEGEGIYKTKWEKEFKPLYDKLSGEDRAIVDRLVKDFQVVNADLHENLVKRIDKLRQGIAAEAGLPIPGDTPEKPFYWMHAWKDSWDFKREFKIAMERDIQRARDKGATEEQIDRLQKKREQDYDRMIAQHENPELYFEIDIDSGELGFRVNIPFGNLLSRQRHIQGYDMSIEAITDYIRRGAKALHYTQAAKDSQDVINGFVNRQMGVLPEDVVDGWRRYMTIYARDNLGYPSRPDRHFKNSLYNAVSDKRIMDLWNRISEKVLGGRLRITSPRQLLELSNAEAKYELAALLFSTKTWLNNIVGGSMNSIIESGIKPWWEAGKLMRGNTLLLEYLPEEYQKLTDKEGNPLDVREKLKRFVRDNGIIEEFLEYEAHLGKSGGKGKIKDFLSELFDRGQAENWKINWRTVKKLGRKYKLDDAVVNKAAFFMRHSEKILRTQSFLTGYLHARKMGLPDPIARELGKKHVRTTQYMYHNAFRPAFARTALGKVLARFQLWTWNSVRFRRHVLEEARKQGYQPGTEGYNRFKRMATLDLFMLAMANAFAFSLFESALPPPYNYVQDTSQLLFGDEEDRDRAFFGTYGLSIVTPPAARVPMQTFRALLSGDWDRWAGYHVWTFFPFGRFVRDVKGVMEVPELAVEKFTGLPQHKLGRYIRRLDKLPQLEHPEGLATGLL